MGLKRNVSLLTALQYKGPGSYLTFILHRIGGLGMALFVGMHILAAFLEGRGLRIGDTINDIYTSPAFQLFVFFCALFHGLNGLRITILDLFPKLIPHYKTAIKIEWTAFILIYCFAFFVIVRAATYGD